MPIIRELVDQINRVFKKAGAAFTRGTKTFIEQSFGRGARADGARVSDIVASIHHVSPEQIASKLNQTTRTTARLLETEPSTVAWPWDKLPHRNLIVAGRLKAARKYRVFYQAQPMLGGVPVGVPQWYSIYTNNLKTFSEYAMDIQSNMERTRSSDVFGVKNIQFHHILHQRGADF